jgi:metal-responsive CopG/Arc/MetJ family transcriptional regulator
MRTIQMTLDDDLVESVDDIVRQLKITRSAFTRQALKQAIAAMRLKQKEELHKKGYQLKPAAQDEFEVWEGEQEWGDK